MNRVVAGWAFFLLAVGPTIARAGTSTMFAPLHVLAAHGARVSALIVRLDDGAPLAALHPNLALTPASVSKLYVAAAALEHWGPDHRFTTRLMGTGPVRSGVLHGNLVFAGAGDPAFTTSDLFRLVRRLVARGIRRIDGNLVIDASWFGSLTCKAADRCAAKHASENAYNALLSSAAVDFGTAEIAVIPAADPGRPATVALEPFPVAMVRIENHVNTDAHDAPWSVEVERETTHGQDVISVRGSVPAGTEPHYYWRAVSNPNRFVGQELHAFLENAGVVVRGRLRVVLKQPALGRPLASLRGQPLGVEIGRMLTWSNNFMADMLALDLLRETRPPPLSVTAAGSLLTRRAHAFETTARLRVPGTPNARLQSGSGLTVGSQASARDLVALLAAAYRHPGLFPSLLGALTVPAYTPVDMLKAPADGVWMRSIAAKTGSLNDPHSVFALAGYARLKDGRWGAFAVLINGTGRYEVPLGSAVAATRAALTPFLFAEAVPPSSATAGIHSRGKRQEFARRSPAR